MNSSQKSKRRAESPRRAPRKAPPKKHWIGLIWLVSLLLLVLLVVFAGAGVQHLMVRKPQGAELAPQVVTPAPGVSPPETLEPQVPKKEVQRQENTPAALEPAPQLASIPLRDPDLYHPRVASPEPRTEIYEIFPSYEYRPKSPMPASDKPAVKGDLPRLAIIIDDLGHNWPRALKFMEIDSALTLAILPNAAHARQVADAALERGQEIMLHLPMEPLEYPRINPGPGALLTTMAPDELSAQLEHDLAAFPGAAGVNNHMGSKLTSQSEPMNQVLSQLKLKGLYYVDSLTTGESVARSSARFSKIPFAERTVFLDHDHQPDQIRRQLKALVRYAKKHGQAVGIGHPYRETLAVLAAEMPQLKDQVRLVRASEVVRIPN